MKSIKTLFAHPSNLLRVGVFAVGVILATPVKALPISQGNTGDDWKKACTAPAGSGGKNKCCQVKYKDCEDTTSVGTPERGKCKDAYKTCTVSIVGSSHTTPGSGTNPGAYTSPGTGTNPGAYIGPGTGTSPSTYIDPGTPTNPSAFSD